MNEDTRQQTAATPTPEASGDQGEKLFTQNDLNRIVSERLARERQKTEPSAIDERETQLKAREARLECREYLDELSRSGKAASAVRGLLEVLDTTDSGRFQETVTALLELGAFNPQLEPLKIHRADIQGGASGEDLIAAAFKVKS